MVNYKVLFIIIFVLFSVFIFVQLQNGQTLGALERGELIFNQLFIHQEGKQIIRNFENHKFSFDYYWYSYFSSKRRTSNIAKYVTPNHESISEYTDYLKYRKTEQNIADSRLLHEIVDFVQKFEYVRDADINFDEYPKYPIETMVEESGDCEDTSILLATLFESFGFDAILVRFSDHMGVGVICEHCIEGSTFTYDGKEYFYVETTGEWEVGKLPEDYYGQNAKLIPVS